MSETSQLIGYGGRTIGREELALVPTPPATETHRPVPHHEIVQALVETLGFRHIGVVLDEYAVSPDGMKVFGVLDLERGWRDGASPSACGTPTTRACVCDDLRVSRIRVLQHGVCRGFRAGARKTLEVLLSH